MGYYYAKPNKNSIVWRFSLALAAATKPERQNKPKPQQINVDKKGVNNREDYSD